MLQGSDRSDTFAVTLTIRKHCEILTECVIVSSDLRPVQVNLQPNS